MSKYVRDTKAAKSIAAYIVLKKGIEIATVNAHFSDGGKCLVNVWANGENSEKKNQSAYLKTYGKPSKEDMYFQSGTAGGYGYDKFTAALSGCFIDGVMMSDHCGRDTASEKMLAAYIKACAGKSVIYGSDFQKSWNKKAAKIGASFANWTESGYQSLHYASGLDKLKAAGYTVLQAI